MGRPGTGAGSGSAGAGGPRRQGERAGAASDGAPRPAGERAGGIGAGTDRGALFGPLARALAPTIAGSSGRGDHPRVLATLLAAGLPPEDRAALASLAGAQLLVPQRGAQRAMLFAPLGALEDLRGRCATADVLLAACDALRAPRARPRLMGVLNVTPDSFSDGGESLDPKRALERGIRLAAEGADAIDVGGESTRPGSEPVPEADELARVLPVVEALAERVAAAISIDTTKAAVAARALDAGASLVNDTSAGRADPDMLQLVAERGCRMVVMHMQGTPRDMQEDPRYGDVVTEVQEFLRERVCACLERGIALESLLVDPGIGFGKTLEHNLELMRRLAELRTLGLPLLLGPSRKSFIATIERRDGLEGSAPRDRLGGTAAAVAACVRNGADWVRVHDVAAMAQAVRVAWALG